MLFLPVHSWPVAVVVCVSVGLAGMLVLYLVVRIRSNTRQRSPLPANGDDGHSQMEWEDDIGLNIIVNPLDESKPVQATHIEQTLNEYDGNSSDDGQDYDGEDHNEYSSEDEEEIHEQINPKKHEHQLEWDDAAIEYGPNRV